MIKIAENWAIEKDPYCLILKQRHVRGKEAKVPGEEFWVNVAYCRDLPDLVKSMVDKELFSHEDGTVFINNYLVSLEYITNMVKKHVSELAQEEISKK